MSPKTKTQSAVPPGTWIHRVETALTSNVGVSRDCLVDPQQALIAWYEAGATPERASELDATDLALARWLSTFPKVTRTTYQQRLHSIAMAMRFDGPRPVRGMLALATDARLEFNRRLREFCTTTSLRISTLRSSLSALHGASRALFLAGIGSGPVAEWRPRDHDVQVRVADPHDVELLNEGLRASNDPLAVRLRAVLQLAWGARLAPKSIVRLDHEHLHLKGNYLVAERERVPLSAEAVDALRAWLAVRGRTDGALFIAFDGRTRRMTNRRVSERVLQREIAKAARDFGVSLTLSGVRAASIARVYDEQGRPAAHRASRNASRDSVNRLLRYRARMSEEPSSNG